MAIDNVTREEFKAFQSFTNLQQKGYAVVDLMKSRTRDYVLGLTTAGLGMYFLARSYLYLNSPEGYYQDPTLPAFLTAVAALLCGVSSFASALRINKKSDKIWELNGELEQALADPLMRDAAIKYHQAAGMDPAKSMEMYKEIMRNMS